MKKHVKERENEGSEHYLGILPRGTERTSMNNC